MRILVLHNTYRNRGGEDVVREAETRLLRGAGHEVIEYVRSNSEFAGASVVRHLGVAAGTVWSVSSSRALREILLREKPEVAHVHNTFPLISPAAYYACAEAGVPVVQTLHNYRLLCPSATFLRDEKICEECLGKSVAWPAVKHGCYRGSRAATAAVAGMLAVHRGMRTWQELVKVYFALTHFAREKFIAGGLPANGLRVKPNFVEHDPGPKTGRGEFILYVGRLSEEKGIRILLQAVKKLTRRVPLKIAGDGPLRSEVLRGAEESAGSTESLGPCSQAEALALMKRAAALVVPSICFENFPLVVAEAAACGLPVIAPRRGALRELVADGCTGVLYEPADARELAAKMEWAWNHPQELAGLGAAARAEYEAKYTSSIALQHLENAYRFASTPSAVNLASAPQPEAGEWANP